MPPDPAPQSPSPELAPEPPADSAPTNDDPLVEAEPSEPEIWALHWVTKVEEAFFLLLLAVLIVAGLSPVLSRFCVGIGEFFGKLGQDWAVDAGTWLSARLSFTSAEALSRQIVLWLALFGAGAATRDRKHISVDALSHFLPARPRLFLRSGLELACAGICGVLVWISVGYVQFEREFAMGGGELFGAPRWGLMAIIPAGLAIMALRFLLVAFADGRAAIRWRGMDQADEPGLERGAGGDGDRTAAGTDGDREATQSGGEG